MFYNKYRRNDVEGKMNNKIEFTETVKVDEVEKVEEKKDKKAIILLLLLLLLLFMISMSMIIFKSKKPTARFC